MVDRTRSAIGDRYHYIKNFMTDRPVAQPNFRDGVAGDHKNPGFV